MEMLTKEQAEQAIVERVKLIDAIRVSPSPDAEVAIAKIDAEIRELKKITGPRHIVGVANN